MKWNLKFHLNENKFLNSPYIVPTFCFDFRIKRKTTFCIFIESFSTILESTKSLLRFKCGCLKYIRELFQDSLSILLFVSCWSEHWFSYYNISKFCATLPERTNERTCGRQAVHSQLALSWHSQNEFVLAVWLKIGYFVLKFACFQYCVVVFSKAKRFDNDFMNGLLFIFVC